MRQGESLLQGIANVMFAIPAIAHRFVDSFPSAACEMKDIWLIGAHVYVVVVSKAFPGPREEGPVASWNWFWSLEGKFGDLSF